MANTGSPTLNASELPRRDVFELRRVLVLDFQQRKVLKFVDGNDAHLFVSLAVELAITAVINLDGNFRFALDDMKIRNQITVRIDEKSRTQTAGRAHLHDGLADLFDEVLHVARDRRAHRRCNRIAPAR